MLTSRTTLKDLVAYAQSQADRALQLFGANGLITGHVGAGMITATLAVAAALELIAQQLFENGREMAKVSRELGDIVRALEEKKP